MQTSHSPQLRRRRAVLRRTWAVEKLRRHVADEAGHCSQCTDDFAVPTPWPCIPARAAAYYALPPGAVQ